jgi:hypothetical protein
MIWVPLVLESSFFSAMAAMAPPTADYGSAGSVPAREEAEMKANLDDDGDEVECAEDREIEPRLEEGVLRSDGADDHAEKTINGC